MSKNHRIRPGKNYRLLKKGEIVQVGDEYTSNNGTYRSTTNKLIWTPTGSSIGKTVGDQTHNDTKTLTYRRKVEAKPVPKPEIKTDTCDSPNPGPGYRLLTVGEKIQTGDEYCYPSNPNKWNSDICLSWTNHRIGDLGFRLTSFRRKIIPSTNRPDPGIGYKLLEKGDLIKFKDEFLSPTLNKWTQSFFEGSHVGEPATNYEYRRKIATEPKEISSEGAIYAYKTLQRLLKTDEFNVTCLVQKLIDNRDELKEKLTQISKLL